MWRQYGHTAHRGIADPEQCQRVCDALGSDARQRVAPTAWRLANNEIRVGLRRHLETDRGEHYQHVMAYYGEDKGVIPTPDERMLGDYLSPVRPFSMTNVVNTVSKELGSDAADWSVKRLLSMIGLIRHQKEQRQDALDE